MGNRTNYGTGRMTVDNRQKNERSRSGNPYSSHVKAGKHAGTVYNFKRKSRIRKSLTRLPILLEFIHKYIFLNFVSFYNGLNSNTLTDHINFAIQRQSQGIQLKNALLWETKRFYHQEYLMGKYAVDLLNEKLGTEFTEDEAGFIALHFVNAEYNTTINDTFEMTNMIQKILELVRLEMGIEFDEESMHYERFITHLKFLVQRLYRHELLKDEEIEFARMMENKYPKEYECSKHIAEYIEKEYGSGIASEEIMFLAIHIKRVCMAG